MTGVDKNGTSQSRQGSSLADAQIIDDVNDGVDDKNSSGYFGGMFGGKNKDKDKKL
jgi:hypothetical protein